MVFVMVLMMLGRFAQMKNLIISFGFVAYQVLNSLRDSFSEGFLDAWPL